MSILDRRVFLGCVAAATVAPEVSRTLPRRLFLFCLAAASPELQIATSALQWPSAKAEVDPGWGPAACPSYSTSAKPAPRGWSNRL
jgi:hypothetical protein